MNSLHALCVLYFIYYTTLCYVVTKSYFTYMDNVQSKRNYDNFPRLTIAIPTMDRFDNFLSLFLPEYLNNPYIAYVLICDENGSDIHKILQTNYFNNSKLILIQNEQQLGIYHNKRSCLENAPTEWVLLSDSDNFFPFDYFEMFHKIWIDMEKNVTFFYGSSNPQYEDMIENKINEPMVDFGSIIINQTNWNSIVYIKNNWNLALNDGNWILHKSALKYLPATVKSIDILATDAIYISRLLVLNGYQYCLFSELRYSHVVHTHSTWKIFEEQNLRIWNTHDYRI